jgi:hypothetical protein
MLINKNKLNNNQEKSLRIKWVYLVKLKKYKKFRAKFLHFLTTILIMVKDYH